MYRYRATLQGDPPGMLQNRMSMEALLAIRGRIKPGKSAPRLSLEDEAASHVHFDIDDRPCVPKNMLMAALINAGVYIRLDNKRQLSTKDSTMLPGLLELEGYSYPLLLPGTGDEATWGLSPWKYDVRQGRNPNGGEAVCIVRPLFERWAITLTALLDTEELSEDQFYRLFTLAGKRIGLADYRPNRKGTFGMYSITRWEKLKEDVSYRAQDRILEPVLV